MKMKDVIATQNWGTTLSQAKVSAQTLNFVWSHQVEVVFKACYNNPNLSPPRLSGHDLEEILGKWIKKYKKGFEGRISQRKSNTPGTVPDPIIDIIIHGRLNDLTESDLAKIKYGHRLSMSAENILGLLLEEYLSEQLADFGWYCAWGETARSVDFCHENGGLLQIKNRSNSENSSSSRVRAGTNIEKWHRVDATSGNYRWNELNKKFKTSRFSEKAFVEFVVNVISNNLAALAIEQNNPWLIEGKWQL